MQETAQRSWQMVYGDDGIDSDDEPPFPKMIDGEDDSLLGPYVPTEICTVEKVELFFDRGAPLEDAHSACERASYDAQALEFAGVGPGDRVLDLGSGDGRFCVAAVQQYGAECAVGVEIDEALVEGARAKAALCGVADRVSFACADLTAPGVDAAALCPGGQAFTLLIVFLLPEAEQRFAGQLRRVVEAGARVLSIAFALDRLPGLTLTRKQPPLYLYCGAADRTRST